jgi:ubiquinone/menaquinone biosynthesis C-methylase UbiE
MKYFSGSAYTEAGFLLKSRIVLLQQTDSYLFSTMSRYDPASTTPSTGPGFSAQAASSISMYNDRAAGYDASTGGWHAELGLDFVNWIAPTPGASVLDLACGTGLVTIPAAKAVGSSGTVVGVDITPGMLREARRKQLDERSAIIEWFEHDITSLNEVEAIPRIRQQKGGFDVISCCSALVLLADPGTAVKHWASFLKPGGKMIIDVPTEDKTLQHLFTVNLRNAMGTSLPFDRSWVHDICSLEKLYEDAGLVVERSWRTRSYIPEKWYEADEKDAVFEEQTTTTYKSFLAEGNLEKARKAWSGLWDANLRDNSKFWDGHPLYVTIGKKALESVIPSAANAVY